MVLPDRRSRRYLLFAVLVTTLFVRPQLSIADALDEFKAFSYAYRHAPADKRIGLAQRYVAQRQLEGGFPIVSRGRRVVFVYLAASGENDVRLLGDFYTRNHLTANWDSRGKPMERLTSGGQVFIKNITFDRDSRVNYGFRVDGTYQLDPFNSHRSEGLAAQGVEGGVASELTMPGFRQPVDTVERSSVPHGQILTIEEPWARSKIQIYLPPAYAADAHYPAIYAADGSAWIRNDNLPTVLDNLIADHEIKPVIVVMIDPVGERTPWYLWNPEYPNYLAQVVQYIDQHYATESYPAGRLHMGASLGGLAGLQVGLQRPDLFGRVAAFSPTPAPPSTLDLYLEGKNHSANYPQVWMSAGSYEGDLFDRVRAMDRYLTRRRVPHRAVYTHESHNVAAWRHLLKDMLIYFLPAGSSRS